MVNTGPRLPLDTVTLPPAGSVIYLHNLEHPYLEQEGPCDVWILIYLEIPASAKVKIRVDLDFFAQAVVPPELLLSLALPNYPGFSCLTSFRHYTYVMDCLSAWSLPPQISPSESLTPWSGTSTNS